MLGLLLATAYAQQLPAGAPVPEALSIQLGTEGLDAAAGLVPGLLPADPILVDDVSDSSGFGCLLGYSYSLTNMWVVAQVVSASIVPADDGKLYISAELSVSVNDATDPFDLRAEAVCIDTICDDSYITPFRLDIDVPLTLTVTGPPGDQVLQATYGELGIDSQLGADDFQANCGLNDIEAVLNIFGISMFDLVIDSFSSSLTPALEQATNDALAGLSLDSEVPLGEAVLSLEIEPTDVIVTAQGLEFVLASIIDAPPNECIADFDPGSFPARGTNPPVASGNPAGTHAAIHVNGDMLNQGLYASWRAGLLCQDIGPEDISLGALGLDTNLLNLLTGDVYRLIFPEAKPMRLVTVPYTPLEADLDGPHDLDIPIEDLGLDFYAELDGRMARVLATEITTDAGVDLVFDEVTGELVTDLVVGEGGFNAVIVGDVLVAGQEQAIEEAFNATMGGILDIVIGGLVGDLLAFPMPTVSGIGLTTMDVDTTGAGSWLALYATIGEASYADPYASGCGGCGSTTTTSTTGGCAVAPGGTLAMLFATLGVLARRRREE